jgi:RsiW-degrading membrane proteinase PrsW (M82 family)
MWLVIGLHVAVALLLVYLFLRNGRGRREPKKALLEAAGLGAAGMIAAGILEAVFAGSKVNANMHFLAHGAGAVWPAVWLFLLVGTIEELVKLLPLTWFVYRRPYFSEHTDGIIYFGFAGLAFGLLENIMYTVTFGAGTGLGRLVMTPYFHASLTGIAGFYIASRKIRHIPMTQVVGAIGVLILLHALYDFCLESGNPLLVLVALQVTGVLVVGLFWFLHLARSLDEKLGLAATHIDKFCPHCGRPNTNRSRYCEHCGQLAST